MKLIVVGTSHAGYEAVETLLADNPDAEIHLFERGSTASFLSCGIQSYLEGESDSLDALHYASEESYKNQNVNIHVNSEVTSIDAEAKTVTVKDTQNTYTENYDKLFISPGAKPIELPIEGSELDNVYYVRGRDWAGRINERMASAKKAIVVGAGYIGIEVAEAFVKAGIETTNIDLLDRILGTYLDSEFTDVLEENAKENGLNVVTGESVQKIVGENGKVTKVVTDKNEYEVDTVIFSVGVKPATSWLEGIVDLNSDGTVAVDEHMQTSDENIFAGGDAVHVPYAPTSGKKLIPLATNARRQGAVAAMNMSGNTVKMPAVSGTSGLALFDYHFATTGLQEGNKNDYEGTVVSKYVEEFIRPNFIGKDKVFMKIFFDKDNHKILGGQIMAKEDLNASINVISAAISSEWTLEKLALADFFFQPEYDRPWNYLNVLAQEALGQTFGSRNMLF